MSEEPSNETRLAVVENTMKIQSQLIEDNRKTTDKLIDRVDTHLLDQAKRDIEITKIIGECTAAIMEWKATAKTFITTSYRIIGIIAVLISAVWAVFTFFYVVNNKPQITIEQNNRPQQKAPNDSQRIPDKTSK